MTGSRAKKRAKEAKATADGKRPATGSAETPSTPAAVVVTPAAASTTPRVRGTPCSPGDPRARALAIAAGHPPSARVDVSATGRWVLVVEADTSTVESGPTTYQTTMRTLTVYHAATGIEAAKVDASSHWSDGDPRCEFGYDEWSFADDEAELVLRGASGSRVHPLEIPGEEPRAGAAAPIEDEMEARDDDRGPGRSPRRR